MMSIMCILLKIVTGKEQVLVTPPSTAAEFDDVLLLLRRPGKGSSLSGIETFAWELCYFCLVFS